MPGGDQGRQGPRHLLEGVQEEDGEDVDHHCQSRKSSYRTVVVAIQYSKVEGGDLNSVSMQWVPLGKGA